MFNLIVFVVYRAKCEWLEAHRLHAANVLVTVEEYLTLLIKVRDSQIVN